jgi:hypothetical protein
MTRRPHGGRASGDRAMCNLYSITTNQAAILALFRVINRYVGNLPPMTGMFLPNYPASVVPKKEITCPNIRK